MFLGCTTAQNKDLTVEEIWEKYLAANSEKKLLDSIKTVYCSTNVRSKQAGYILNCSMIKPNKTYCEMIFDNGAKTEVVYNNGKGIFLVDGKKQDMKPENLWYYKKISSLFYELYYKQLGCKLYLLDDEIINGVDCYKIELSSKFTPEYYLISKDSFELIKVIYSNGIMIPTNIVDINGIKILKNNLYIINNDTLWVENLEYKTNIKFDESLFEID